MHTFKDEYAKQNHSRAYDAFINALKLDADYAYREVAGPSGAIAQVARLLDKIDDTVEILDKSFRANPHMHLMCSNNKEQIDSICQLREDNIAKGMPSPLLITMAKSGSISAANIFTSGLNLPSFSYSFLNVAVVPSWARDYARGGACYVTHLIPFTESFDRLKAAGINKIIVHVRDPRQAVLSLLHHYERYPDQEPDKKRLAGLSLEERLLASLDVYLNFVFWISGWIKASQSINIHFSTFEQFVTDRDKFTQGYLDYYGPYSKHFNADRAFTEHAGLDYHRRLGEIDEWRRVFTPETQKLLTALLPDIVKEKFGWQ